MKGLYSDAARLGSKGNVTKKPTTENVVLSASAASLRSSTSFESGVTRLSGNGMALTSTRLASTTLRKSMGTESSVDKSGFTQQRRQKIMIKVRVKPTPA